MYDDKNVGGERLSGYGPESEKRGEYADLWEDADMMENAPDFAGEDMYGNPIDEEGEVILSDEKEQSLDVDRYETKKTADRGYGGAEKLTSYGLDTAARIYGLESVLKAVSETDESDRDAYNPMGSIYSRLVPNPDERKNLYTQIQKESVDSDADDDIPDGSSKDKLGIDGDGNIYALDGAEPGTSSDELAKYEVNNAVRQMKKLLEALQNSERFASLRERAAKEGKDVISYITSGVVNPTITTLFDGLDANGVGSVEEILDEIEEEEKLKEAEENEEKIEDSETELEDTSGEME